jgi:curved DNA-binding protein CbpA
VRRDLGSQEPAVTLAPGTLQDEPLPLVLYNVHAGKLTGTLKLETRVGRHEVFVREGYPVSVSLPGSAELLGKVLVEMGILDEATHKRTLAEPPPKGKKYGEWLVENKLVTADQMRLALKAQVRRKLHRLFFLNEGQFSFADGEHQMGLDGHESLKIHPSRAIYQGVRSAWTAERLAGALFLLEGKAIKLKLDEQAMARYGVGPEDARIAELLRKGYWTVRDLVEATALPVQPVHALVYALYVTEGLDIKGADEVPRLRRKDTSGVSQLPTPPPASKPTESAVMRKLATETSTQRAVPVLNPLITPARQVPTPPRGVTQTPSSSSLAPQTPPRGTNASDPLSMRQEIEAKAKLVDQQNLYQVLGVPENATRDQIKTAYFDAAKRYHPDRLSSLGLESLRGQTEKIFRRVSEAHATLSDDTKRDEYRKVLANPALKEKPDAHQQAMKILEAEMAFRRGEILLRKNDYAGAIAELEQAVAGNPAEGEHLAWLAWARISAGQLSFADAKARFQEATKLSPRCARAYYFLGLCCKEEKDLDRAMSAFKKAAELDERLIEAEREIRLINMRKEKSGGGWFSRKK